MSHKDGRQHPVLAVVDPQGLLLVIGRTQARLAMTPTMMRQKAIELLRYAEEAEREKNKTGGGKQD